MKFNNIWDKYRGHLFNFIRERIDSLESTEDILQEVAIKFDATLKNGEIERPKSWLFQVARNTIADYYRGISKKRESAHADIPDLADQHVYNPCVCDLTGFVIQHYLPEKYGQALFMADIEKIPQKEIAEKINLSLTATKSRIQRARKLLRERIEACVDITYQQDGTISDFSLKSGCVLPPELLKEMNRLNLSL